MSMLSIQGIGKTFPSRDPNKEVIALSDIELEVEEGEFISVIGPSGCGKSTLMDIIAGLEAQTTGRLMIGNDEVTKPHKNVGVVFQQDATFPWLTNLENVKFALKNTGLSKEEQSIRAQEALELVDVAAFANHYPSQLSGGMRQRVNIARVLAARPQILLLDEPFGALDEQTRLTLGDELLHIWRETKATVVFITHSLSEAAMLSDRIVVMTARPGKIKDIVVTNLPKSRTSAVIGTPEFAQISGRLWEELSKVKSESLAEASRAAAQ